MNEQTSNNIVIQTLEAPPHGAKDWAMSHAAMDAALPECDTIVQLVALVNSLYGIPHRFGLEDNLLIMGKTFKLPEHLSEMLCRPAAVQCENGCVLVRIERGYVRFDFLTIY